MLYAFVIYRLFGDTFSHLGIDLEAVLSVMSIHPQYCCVAQIREQLASDGPVSFFSAYNTNVYMYKTVCAMLDC